MLFGHDKSSISNLFFSLPSDLMKYILEIYIDNEYYSIFVFFYHLLHFISVDWTKKILKN